MKKKITVTCDKCHNEFSMTEVCYKKKVKNNERILCQPCRMKEMSEKARNISEEDKIKYREKLSEAQKKRWSKTSDEERKRITAPMLAKTHENYNNLSAEEKKARHDRLQAGNSKWWNSLSPEEKAKYGKIRSKASRDFWDSVTPEMMVEIGKRQSKGIKKFWDDMTDEEFKVWLEKHKEGLSKYFTERSENGGLTNNEITMEDILKTNNLKYSTHSYSKLVHPDFDTLFPVNTATGSTNISPYHEWDFRVHTLDGDVLVDIDGSVHDPKNKTTGVTEFNDSKRPYQTDNLPAYAVLCYDDNITKDTPVLNIVSGEKIALSNLMSILSWMNMTKKEKKKISKL